MITNTSIHHTRQPTDATRRANVVVYIRKHTNKNPRNQSRTSSRASRHVHHTLAVVIHPVLGIRILLLLPRFILDILGVVRIRVRTTDVPGIVLVRSHSRSSLRARTSIDECAPRNQPKRGRSTETNAMKCGISRARERERSRPLAARSRRVNPVHSPHRPSSPAFGGSSVRCVVNSFVSLCSFRRAHPVASASKTRVSFGSIPPRNNKRGGTTRASVRGRAPSPNFPHGKKRASRTSTRANRRGKKNNTRAHPMFPRTTPRDAMVDASVARD